MSNEGKFVSNDVKFSVEGDFKNEKEVDKEKLTKDIDALHELNAFLAQLKSAKENDPSLDTEELLAAAFDTPKDQK